MSENPPQPSPSEGVSKKIQEAVRQLYQQANTYIAENKLEEAIACYRKSIALVPTLGDAYQKWGNLLVKTGQLEAAIATYQQAIKLSPEDSWSYNSLGGIFIKLERWEEAVPVCQQAVRLDPNSFWDYNNLGLALTKLERWEEAIEAYEKAAEINSSFFWTYNNWGDALMVLERWEEAVPVYRKAIEIDPNFVWANTNLGDALRHLKRWKEAVPVYQKSCELNPNFFWSHSNLGDILFGLKRYKEAIPVYQQAVKIQPDSPQTHYKLAKVLMKAQKFEDAIASFERVLELKPDFHEAHQKLQDAQNQLQQVQHQKKRDNSPIEPVDWMKYYPKMGNSVSYLMAKPTPAPKDPKTGEWKFPVPPRPLMFVFADQGEEYYLNSGKIQIRLMFDSLQKAKFSLGAGSRILDFGCASGRMIRFLSDRAEAWEIWGADISADCIFWCKEYMSPPFHFLTCTTHPHLPFEDRYFDLVYAGSVFTHIDDLADAWRLELRRILKPGGMAYITIQERHLINLIKGFKEQWLANNNIWPLGKKTECLRKYEEYSNSDFAMFTLGRDTRSLVFYDLDYFCDMVQPFFKVVEVRKEAYYWQTAVLLERQ